LLSVTGFENVTETAVFDATFRAPAAGVEDLTKNPLSDALAVPLDPERPEPEEEDAELCGCDGGDDPVLKTTTAAMMRVTAPATIKSGRDGSDRLPRDSCAPLIAASA
jgi:hypothetical protein